MEERESSYVVSKSCQPVGPYDMTLWRQVCKTIRTHGFPRTRTLEMIPSGFPEVDISLLKGGTDCFPECSFCLPRLFAFRSTPFGQGSRQLQTQVYGDSAISGPTINHEFYLGVRPICDIRHRRCARRKQ